MFVVATGRSKFAKAAADHFENTASMALNPPLLPGSTLPLPVNGETFVLQRKGIQLDADILVGLFLVLHACTEVHISPCVRG